MNFSKKDETSILGMATVRLFVSHIIKLLLIYTGRTKANSSTCLCLEPFDQACTKRAQKLQQHKTKQTRTEETMTRAKKRTKAPKEWNRPCPWAPLFTIRTLSSGRTSSRSIARSVTFTNDRWRRRRKSIA